MIGGHNMDKNNSLVPAGRAELIPETQNMVSLAEKLHESGMFPNAGKVAGIVTIMEYGRELGIPPVAALNTMVVVRGKLTMESKAMLAVARNIAGISWKIDKLDDTECTMTFSRPGFEPCPVTFTFAEAKAAGLDTKDAWKMYRQDMLFARCASRGVRRFAPDAVLGLYSSEEMRDVEAIDVAKKDLEGGAKAKKSKPAPEPEPEKPVPAPTQTVTDFPEEETKPEPEMDPEVPWEEKKKSPPEEKPTGPENDPILNSYVADIRVALKKESIEDQDFMQFLLIQGPKMNRHYVGSDGSVLRFQLGNKDDVKYLASVIEKAISLYYKASK
jgi:hypothetical protein